MNSIATARQHWRPMSLAEAAERAAAHGHVDIFLREFLDSYYVEDNAQRRRAMLEAEPRLLPSAQANAYFAAVAEHLARLDRAQPPDWVNAQGRFLRRAFFPCGLESLKATLIKESPAAFRRRMIFVEADPLSRPRRRGVRSE